MMGMPSCRELTRAVAAGALEDAPLLRRLGIRAHMMFCRHCNRYVRQMQAIGMAAREALSRPSGEEESLERLRGALLARLEPPETD